MVLTHQKMPSHTLLLQKKFKITKSKSLYNFQPTGAGDKSRTRPVSVGVLVDLTDRYARVSVACEKV